MSPNKRATISDVAKAAGVSKQTISRVINDSPNVTPATREKILKVIADLGYRRSEMARNLNLGRSFTLGIVGSGLAYFGSQTYQGIASRVEEKGYTLLIKELPDSRIGEVENVIHNLLDRQVDGILWAIPEAGNNHAWLDSPLYASITVPVVFVATAPRADISIVTYDNFETGQLATRHLIDSGHKCIGHIAGPKNAWVAQERLRGWQSALNEAGLPAHPEHMVHGANWEVDSGAPAFTRLLESYPEMDAVFVSNDWLAVGVLLACHQRGIRVPEDIAVIGTDSQPVSAYLYPPLSTVFQNKRALGLQAIDLLIHQIESRQGRASSPFAADPLTLQLVVRESAP